MRVRRLVGMLSAAVIAALTFAPIGAQSGAGKVVIRVVTGDGQPVTDLKSNEVSLRVDGKPREVKELELVEPAAGAAAADGSKAPAAAMLPAPYVTNAAPPAAPSGSREFIIGIDDEGIAMGRDQSIKDTVAKLVRSFSPSDRVGLVSLRNGGLSLAPTTDHAAILAALPKIVPTGSPSESLVDFACRTKLIMGNLVQFLRTGGPERTIVFFVGGLAPPTEETVRQSLTPNATACEIRNRELEDFGRNASASAPAFFIVADQEATPNSSNRTAGQAGAESIAGVGGGDLLRLVGAGDAVVERITRTAGTYYIATLDGPFGGEVRRIDVRVNRDGLRAQARPTRDEGGRGAGYAVGRGGSGGKVTPRDMIRVPNAFRDLPLRAAGFVSRQQGSKDLKVMALFEPDGEDVKLTAAVVGLFNEKGELKAQWTAQSGELQRSPVIAALTVAPGTYRMRVAATDAEGRAGATDVPLRVELLDAGSLKLAPMMLSADQNSPRLLFHASDQAVIGFIQAYGVTKDTNIAVTYEIRESETAQPLGTMEGNVLQMPNEPDARLIWGGFGLPALQPGDYLMRAVIKVNGQEVATPSRTLRKLK